MYGLDYNDTFSPVAKLSLIHLFLSLTAMNHWPLYKLVIKNTFMHGDLERGDLYIATSWLYCSRGVWSCFQVTKIIVWSKTITSNLVWKILQGY